MGFVGWRITAIPSLATNQGWGYTPRDTASFHSMGVMSREARAMSTTPSMRAAIPTPEPPPATETTASGCRSMKASAHSWAMGRRVVDPLRAMVSPARAREVEREKTKATRTAVPTISDLRVYKFSPKSIYEISARGQVAVDHVRCLAENHALQLLRSLLELYIVFRKIFMKLKPARHIALEAIVCKNPLPT